jgi:hypothetical protein
MILDHNGREVCRMAGNTNLDTPLDIELPYVEKSKRIKDLNTSKRRIEKKFFAALEHIESSFIIVAK